MNIDMTQFFTVQTKRGPNSEKASSVNLLWDFLGEKEIEGMISYFKLKDKKGAYGFLLKKVGKCTYGDVISIIKDLENLPLKYNKTATVINKLKKFNGTRTK